MVRETVPVSLQPRPADLSDPAVIAFLAEHMRDMQPTAPVESRHALDLDGLAAAGVRVWAVVDEQGAVVATGASAPVEPGHEEIKSMRVAPQRRGHGWARRMLEHLIQDASARGIIRLSLETGSMDFFAPARKLYATAGFVECPPFGAYVADPNSVFMTRRLALD